MLNENKMAFVLVILILASDLPNSSTLSKWSLHFVVYRPIISEQLKHFMCIFLHRE